MIASFLLSRVFPPRRHPPGQSPQTDTRRSGIRRPVFQRIRCIIPLSAVPTHLGNLPVPLSLTSSNSGDQRRPFRLADPVLQAHNRNNCGSNLLHLVPGRSQALPEAANGGPSTTAKTLTSSPSWPQPGQTIQFLPESLSLFVGIGSDRTGSVHDTAAQGLPPLPSRWTGQVLSSQTEANKAPEN